MAKEDYCWCGLVKGGACTRCWKELCEGHLNPERGVSSLNFAELLNLPEGPWVIAARLVYGHTGPRRVCHECRLADAQSVANKVRGLPWPEDPFEFQLMAIARGLGLPNVGDTNTIELIGNWVSLAQRLKFPLQQVGITLPVEQDPLLLQYQPMDTTSTHIEGWHFENVYVIQGPRDHSDDSYYHGVITPDGNIQCTNQTIKTSISDVKYELLKAQNGPNLCSLQTNCTFAIGGVVNPKRGTPQHALVEVYPKDLN